MKKVLLIIPAYNEEKNILRVYREIEDYNKGHSLKYDCLVINDGSKDQTREILDKYGIPHVHLIENLGIGGAVQTGYLYALSHEYDIAVQFDGDGQHDIRYVSKIIEPILKNEQDFVIGSRFVEKISSFQTTFGRRIGIRIISFVIKLNCGVKIYDTTSGFRACNQKIIREFASQYPTEYPEPITIAQLIKKKYRVKEVGVNMKERIAGKTSIRAWKEIYYMMNVCLSIFMIGLRRYK